MDQSDIKSQETLYCTNCAEPLIAVLITTSPTELKFRYKIVDCYKCHKDSLASKVFVGQGYVLPFGNMQINMIDTEEKSGVIVSTIKVTKE